jgi:hypothetical protein
VDTEHRPIADLESDLRATSDDLAADAERMRRIEVEKGELDLGDPRLAELSKEGEPLTEARATKARAESALVDEVQDGSD